MINFNNLICQSCGMPMRSEKDLGSNEDGSKNEDYCQFCFEGGRFKDEGITVQQKIEKNLLIAKKMGIPEDNARALANEIFPKLKRWRGK